VIAATAKAARLEAPMTSDKFQQFLARRRVGERSGCELTTRAQNEPDERFRIEAHITLPCRQGQ
jgi:hypothetical protein